MAAGRLWRLSKNNNLYRKDANAHRERNDILLLSFAAKILNFVSGEM
jgi:hypothetical protein